MGLWPTHKVEGCTWDGTDSKRSSFKLVKLWVPSSISRIHLPADIAQNPQFIGFGARFVYLPKKPTRCSRRMCKMTKAAWDKFKKLGKWFEQRTRAQNSENYGFKANFTQILFCVDMARNPECVGFGARLAHAVAFFPVKQDKSNLHRPLLPRVRAETNTSQFL